MFKNFNFEYLGFLFLAAFPIYPYFLLSLSMISFCVFTLIDFFLRKKSINKKRIYIPIIFTFYIFLMVSSILIEGFHMGYKPLRASMVIFVLPFLSFFFSRLSINSEQKRKIFLIFTLASFLLAILIIITSVIRSLDNEIAFYNIVRVSAQNISFIDIHPVYVSMYFIVSIFYILSSFKRIKKLPNKILSIIVIAFFSLMILLLVSRIAIFTCIILLFLMFIKNNKITLFKKILYSLITISLIIFSLLIIKPLRAQFDEISSKEEFVLPYKKFPTSPQIRIGIYTCSWSIIESNWIMGYGALDFQKKLNKCYEKYNNYQKINYNTHNYYLFLLGSGGIICLVLFLGSIFFQIKSSIFNKNFLHLVFILIIITFSLSENILSRSYGATFFTFFTLLFLSVSKQDSDRHDEIRE
ncbi:O-antigen ligase family protein [Aquimarina longa]|uniref:O-antigen ligase family protein n=1 Tax=Aquimarina longa TaxID=1080221 RepID=UPI000784692D